jgi:hypothetical protein
MTLFWNNILICTCYRQPSLLSVVIMETSPLTHVLPNPGPKSSQKRTSSPGAPAAPTKKPKTGPGQGYSDKTKRRRKKKKLPITRESGSGIMSGLGQDVRFSSHLPRPSLPSASSTKNWPSFISSQSGSLPGGSSNPPSPVCAPPGAISSSEAQLVNERVVEALHAESKVRLSSLFSFDGVQTLFSPSATIKPFWRALCRLLCARSVLIYSTSLSHYPHVVMPLVMAALSTGLKLISKLIG